MKIIDLFRRLSYGELSNLALSNSGSGEIREENQPQLVHHINDGLLRLYSRFPLKIKEVIIQQVDNVTLYPLRRKYAETTEALVPYRFIKDTLDEPFEEDVILIQEVYDEYGQRILNDKSCDSSWFTPQADVLQIPDPDDGKPVSVIYQARHKKLDSRPDHIIEQEIEIPFFLENALQSFVGYRVFSNMNGQENTIKAQEYLAAYEALCLDIEQRDLANQTFHTSHDKLEQRGFV